MHFYKHKSKIGRNNIKSDRNLFAAPSRAPNLMLSCITFHSLSFQPTSGQVEGGGNRLPVSISGLGPAGVLEDSFSKFLREIILGFQFHF